MPTQHDLRRRTALASRHLDDLGVLQQPLALTERTPRLGADPKCVVECVKGMNGKYVLYDAKAKAAYVLSDQKTPEKFAAKKVTVTGTLDEKTKTIKVDSIKAAK